MAAGAGAAADRHGHRPARPVAGGRAALRPRRARHGRDRRLVAAAGRRTAVCGQAAAVLLADRDWIATDALVARRVPVAIVSRGFGCVVLVYDLGRRLWNREAGLAARWRCCSRCSSCGRRGRRRSTRRCASGRRWACTACCVICCSARRGAGTRSAGRPPGFGVITKGVGFLPLLVLIPFASARSRWQPRHTRLVPRWFLGPLAFSRCREHLARADAARGERAIRRWRVSRRHPVSADHRSLRNAWHHREPFWYFLVNVIPGCGCRSRLVPWLFRHWRNALRSFDLRIALLSSWIVLVVLFFSFSTGKRGVYVLPAVPAFALALCAIPRAGRDASRGATCDVCAGFGSWRPDA